MANENLLIARTIYSGSSGPMLSEIEDLRWYEVEGYSSKLSSLPDNSESDIAVHRLSAESMVALGALVVVNANVDEKFVGNITVFNNPAKRYRRSIRGFVEKKVTEKVVGKRATMPYAHIQRLDVDPSYRNRGIGSILLAEGLARFDDDQNVRISTKYIESDEWVLLRGFHRSQEEFDFYAPSVSLVQQMNDRRRPIFNEDQTYEMIERFEN